MKEEKCHQDCVSISSSWQAITYWRYCRIFLIIVLLLCQVVPCSAKEKDIYPAGKINWLVPYKAGGGFDLVARGIAPYLSQYLQEGAAGAQIGIVMRNEPASGGRKAYGVIYNAKPDGHTIGAFDIGFISETFTEDVGFDISKFTFLVRAMKTDRLIVTNKNGFANWDELVKAAKIRPLKWGTGAFLQSTQLDSIVLTERMGIPARFIPWAGGTSESMNALMRGDIQAALVSDDSVKGLLDAGEIRPLAVISEKSKYPGVPSIKDLGHPDLADKLGTQRFVIAPPGLPIHIKNSFISAYKKVMSDQKYLSYAKKLDLDFKPLYGEEAEKAFKIVNGYYQNDLKPLYIKYSK
jgi:tripartite-type tricarboxylate transporter receptor subunit TctC